jgi:abscission/NoCut checkpoint regulator
LKIEQRDETEQEEVDRTVLQYIEEAKLPDFDLDPDEQELIESIPPAPNKQDTEELPFCEICNEDAVIRCLECENIFCHRCFLEFHDEEDYRAHKTKPYTAPNQN